MDVKEKYLMKEYKGRINKVMDYISFHLDGNLSLRKLAGVANFSVYHFHRVFQKVAGETVNHFIRRIRLEFSANKLMNNPKLNITEIAYSLGFFSSVCFAREFRRYFSMSATEYRYRELLKKARLANRKVKSAKRKVGLGKKGIPPLVTRWSWKKREGK